MFNKPRKIHFIVLISFFCFLIYSERASATVTSKIRKGHDFSKIKPNAKYKPNEIIVKFAEKPGKVKRSKEEKNRLLANLNQMRVIKSLKKFDLDIIAVPDGTIKQALKVLNQKSEVLYAEPNYEIIMHNLPTDTSFNQLWGLNNTGQTSGTVDADIDALEAWDIITDANDIIVAVIDTGVDYTHEDLAGNI